MSKRKQVVPYPGRDSTRLRVVIVLRRKDEVEEGSYRGEVKRGRIKRESLKVEEAWSYILSMLTARPTKDDWFWAVT